MIDLVLILFSVIGVAFTWARIYWKANNLEVDSGLQTGCVFLSVLVLVHIVARLII